MKKLFAFCLVLGLVFFFISPQKLSAEQSANITISDAIYADLALRNYLDNVSIYSFNGNDLDTVSINPLRQWLPASTIKVFVAMYAYNQINQGKLNLYDTFPVEDKNVVPTELVTDEFPTLQAGNSVTLQRLIKQMLVQSDNTAYNVLIDILDRQKITDYVRRSGLTHTNIGSKLNLDTSQEQYEFNTPGYGVNTTTAEDYARAFILIKKKEIPGSKDLYSILTQQKINNMIPLLLPKEVVVAHKTGDLDPLYHDGGIIEAKTGSYVLSIFSNLGDPNIVAHLSELIYTKNYDLVGVEIKAKNLGEESMLPQPIDPLVLAPRTNTQVLGASTQNVQVPEITAADLGIKASDLSLTRKSNELPKILVPADSPLHFLITASYVLKKGLSLGSLDRARTDVNYATLQIAEAKDLQKRGKNTMANAILEDVQQRLNDTAKNKALPVSVQLQTAIQANSETRFAILGDELKNSSKPQRMKILKQIAQEAKETVKNVNPFIPRSINTTNPNQKPLIGEVLSKSDTTITIKTAGGQNLTAPTNNNLNVRSKDGKTSSLSSIKKGTTIALVGSYTGNSFTPSFALTNLPKELVAPQPVVVIKVNTKSNTMVVSQNGIPMQVNINPKTIIKGEDTSVSEKSIKQGDWIVVRGEIIIPKTEPKTQQKTTISITPTTPIPASNKQTTGTTPTSVPTPNKQGVKNNEEASVNQNNMQPKQNNPSQTNSSTSKEQPIVIQSTTIQIVGNSARAQNTKANPQPTKENTQQKKSENKPLPTIIPTDKKNNK